MAEIRRGRYAGELDGDFVVFLIGARINKPWQLIKAARDLGEPRRGMRAMLDELMAHPEKGLLGGMMEVPGTEWSETFDVREALTQMPALGLDQAIVIKWRRLPGVVTHTFTHFPLELVVLRARLPKSATAPQGMRWIACADIASAALPSVMRKVLAHALGD